VNTLRAKNVGERDVNGEPMCSYIYAPDRFAPDR
jgi:hypothetical protein